MPVTRLNYFTAKPDQIEALAAFLQRVIAAVRNADGCLSCRLLRDVANSNEFVIVESWSSKQAHQKAASIIPQEQIASVMQYLAARPTGAYYEPSA
jgi:quinol monooxygenase YgiN